MTDAFGEIVRACLEDERLLRVVQEIGKLSREDKSKFLSKVKEYFFEKTDQADVEAYKFYLFILEDDNAEKVLSLIDEEKVKSLGS